LRSNDSKSKKRNQFSNFADIYRKRSTLILPRFTLNESHNVNGLSFTATAGT